MNKPTIEELAKVISESIIYREENNYNVCVQCKKAFIKSKSFLFKDRDKIVDIICNYIGLNVSWLIGDYITRKALTGNKTEDSLIIAKEIIKNLYKVDDK